MKNDVDGHRFLMVADPNGGSGIDKVVEKFHTIRIDVGIQPSVHLNADVGVADNVVLNDGKAVNTRIMAAANKHPDAYVVDSVAIGRVGPTDHQVFGSRVAQNENALVHLRIQA